MTDSWVASFLHKSSIFKNCLFSKLKCLYEFLMLISAMLSFESANMVTYGTRQSLGTPIGRESNKRNAQSRNFVTDQLNDVENTHDYHILMVIVEALWTGRQLTISVRFLYYGYVPDSLCLVLTCVIHALLLYYNLILRFLILIR